MKILVLTQYFFPHTGGSQEYILELYKEVIRQNPAIQVDVICYNTDNAPKYEKIDGVSIYRIPCLQVLPGQFALPNFFKLMDVLKQLKQTNKHYDIVNSHTRFFDNSWWGPLAARYFQAIAVLTDHCASHPVHPNVIINTGMQLFDTLLVKYVPHMYHQVCSISQATSNFLKKQGYQKTILVFYSGIHRAFIANRTTALPIRISSKSIVISFVGRMIPSKNPALALKVAQQITKKYPHALFIFAGSGPELKNLITAENKQIKFVGTLDRAKTAAFLKRTDILIHPSTHHEGLPITLLEAGASKVAVIASNAGATKELIANGRTGLIANSTVESFTKSVQRLIEDSILRNRLATDLQKKVISNFNWQSTAAEYVQFLETLIKH